MMDMNSPVTNPELVKIMSSMALAYSPELELAFIQALYQARFLAPIMPNKDIESGSIHQDSTVSFKLLTNKSNHSFFMAFTDASELKKWSATDEQTLILTYNDLANMLKESGDVKGFVIDPFGSNLVISPEAINHFAQRLSQQLQ